MFYFSSGWFADKSSVDLDGEISVTNECHPPERQHDQEIWFEACKISVLSLRLKFNNFPYLSYTYVCTI